MSTLIADNPPKQGMGTDLIIRKHSQPKKEELDIWSFGKHFLKHWAILLKDLY